MRFTNIGKRTMILAFAIAASVAAAVVAFNVAGNGQTGAASNFRDVQVNQTIQQGDVSVTLSSLRLGENETQLRYRYDAPGEQVEPLGLPIVTLPDGSRLEANGGGGFDGEMLMTMPITRMFTLPSIPEDADTIAVDVGSFIQYVPIAAVPVEIPLGDALDDAGRSEREELPLDVEFSIGDAEYRVTRLLLEPDSFVLVCEPTNEAASRMILGGQSASISLTDNQGTAYPGFLAGAEWYPADDGGHVMSYQGFHFSGMPNPDATSLSLSVDGVGKIQAPFVFQVEIPQEDAEG